VYLDMYDSIAKSQEALNRTKEIKKRLAMEAPLSDQFEVHDDEVREMLSQIFEQLNEIKQQFAALKQDTPDSDSTQPTKGDAGSTTSADGTKDADEVARPDLGDADTDSDDGPDDISTFRLVW